MGHRLEVYVAPEHAATVIEVSKSFGVDAQIVGRVEALPAAAGAAEASPAINKKVTVSTPHGTFEYF
jgi:phosphoribosylformylglycinamidine cyclo-ligase